MAKRYRVTLTAEEREALGGMISRGKADARKLAHARVLLQADASEGGPDWTDTRIAEAVRVSVRTLERVRQRFGEDGLEAALLPRPSPRVYARKLDGGASRPSTRPSSCSTWKTCWRSITARMTRSGRWCAWTNAASS